MSPALAVLVALVGAVAATPLAIVVATRLDVVDHPGPAKPQAHAVPYLGGVAVMIGLVVPVAVLKATVLVPASLALGLGLLDDVRDLAPWLRLFAELGIGVVAAWLFPTGLVEPLGFVAVAAGVVVLINAVNVIDGLDGLASSVVAIAAVGFVVILDGPERTVAFALAGALAGFLVFNRPPARIYLGDAGSYLLGTLLAILLAMAWASDRSASIGIGAFLLVMVPVAELGFSVVRRLVQRQPLFTSDRGHSYDQLVARSWSSTRALLAFAGIQGLLTAAAILASLLEPILAVLVVLACAATLAVTLAASGFATSRPSGTTT